MKNVCTFSTNLLKPQKKNGIAKNERIEKEHIK